MAHSSRAKGNISIDLCKLPILRGERRQNTMFCEDPKWLLLLDGKNFRLSQIINMWTFGQLTPDGNEGVGVEIVYLKHAYGMKYYIVHQVNGNINVIHDDNLRVHRICGLFLSIWSRGSRIKGLQDPRLLWGPGWLQAGWGQKAGWHKVHQAHSNHLSQNELCTFNELEELIHEGKVYTTEQHSKLYFSHVEIINDLVESYQAYWNLMASQPNLEGECAVKRAEQASYYDKIFRNVDVVLQMDQVHHIHEELPQLPSPRYTPTRGELENEDLQVIIQSAHVMMHKGPTRRHR